jgi:hypothetical protein
LEFVKKIKNKQYLILKGLKGFIKTTVRKERFRLRKNGFLKYQADMRDRAKANGKKFKSRRKSISFHPQPLPPKPELQANIKFLSTVPDLFSKKDIQKNTDGYFYIPECFSLIENYKDSFNFLKQLFEVLLNGEVDKVTLDYRNCKRIDVDASICMDVILAEFIEHIKKCRRSGYQYIQYGITPVSFENPDIMKVLFSIGAYRNLKGWSISYPDVEALPVLVNDQNSPEIWSKSEIDLTQIVEYIKQCLKRLERELTTEAETEFYKVIGEIMSNAEEHATMPNRFAIGFFQETHNDLEHFGVFNFSIFNFGKTIYETFKDPNCPNKKVVSQMAHLSEEYTKNGWFKKADFEEETLWTLYALQEGVTSKEKKRGNGSIQYIENFFKLKGDLNQDNNSKLVVVSGNTRILFDGTYRIIEKEYPGEKRKPKMVTFNESGEIFDKPDKNFVTFAPHFFPGTLISARILINFDNTTAQKDGSENI